MKKPVTHEKRRVLQHKFRYPLCLKQADGIILSCYMAVICMSILLVIALEAYAFVVIPIFLFLFAVYKGARTGPVMP